MLSPPAVAAHRRCDRRLIPGLARPPPDPELNLRIASLYAIRHVLAPRLELHRDHEILPAPGHRVADVSPTDEGLAPEPRARADQVVGGMTRSVLGHQLLGCGVWTELLVRVWQRTA